jgi:hypothetical protein
VLPHRSVAGAGTLKSLPFPPSLPLQVKTQHPYLSDKLQHTQYDSSVTVIFPVRYLQKCGYSWKIFIV